MASICLNCVHYSKEKEIKNGRVRLVNKCAKYPEIVFLGTLLDGAIKDDCGEFVRKNKKEKKSW